MPEIHVMWCMINCKSYCWVGLRKPEDLIRGYSWQMYGCVICMAVA
jgi:hypothetical protein